jgi:hypothetical protein
VCVFRCEGGRADSNGDLEEGAGGDGCECFVETEICNGIDDDCDGEVDEGLTNGCGGCRDLEQEPGTECGDEACRGLWTCFEDNESVFCDNGTGNDCGGCEPLEEDSGVFGEACGECGQLACDELGALTCVEHPEVFFVDMDGDAYGGEESAELCEATAPFTATRAGDCNDNASAVKPGAVEECDGFDNDCDNLTDALDDGLAAVLCQNQTGVCIESQDTCVEGAWAGCGEASFTAAAEASGQSYEVGPEVLCEGVDNDCDGGIDENCCTRGDEGIRTLHTVATGRSLLALDSDFSPDSSRLAVLRLETTTITNNEEGGKLTLTQHGRLGQALSGSFVLSGNNNDEPQVVAHGDGVELFWIDRARGLDSALWMGLDVDAEAVSEPFSLGDDVKEIDAVKAGDSGALVAALFESDGSSSLRLFYVEQGLDPFQTRDLTSGDLSAPVLALSARGGGVVGFRKPGRVKWVVFDGGLSARETQSLVVSNDSSSPTVASTQDGFIIAYVDGGTPTLFLQLTDDSGRPVGDPAVIDSEAGISGPQLLAFEDNLVLVWNGPERSLRSLQIGPDGVAISRRVDLEDTEDSVWSIAGAASRQPTSANWLALLTLSNTVELNGEINSPLREQRLEALGDRLNLGFYRANGGLLCFSE